MTSADKSRPVHVLKFMADAIEEGPQDVHRVVLPKLLEPDDVNALLKAFGHPPRR